MREEELNINPLPKLTTKITIRVYENNRIDLDIGDDERLHFYLIDNATEGIGRFVDDCVISFLRYKENE